FYYRVVEAMQMGVATPVLLWLLSAEHAVPAAERARSLAALESWLVRRMLLRLTTKDINRMTVALLKELSTGEPSDTGTITERFLASQTAWSRYWPTDDELISSVATAKLYGVVQQGRIRMVLEAIEDAKRTAKSEIPRCPRSLQVEHIMPQSWHSHWGSDIDGEPLAAAARDRMVQTLGNLTLVTAKLNPSLANLPWLDDDATQIKPRSEGKRTQLDQHSLLLLNRELVKRHPDRWTEDDIASRGKALSAAVAVIWPRPASTI
ncbi:MAG: HNH endonuclease family protein, partial [Pseudonocardiaceae bacterium]